MHLGGSVLIQTLFSALYTKLIEATKPGPIELHPVNVAKVDNKIPIAEPASVPPKMSAKATICNMLAEAICSIDEDNKHTDAIHALINQARESQRATGMAEDTDGEGAVGLSFVSTVKVSYYLYTCTQ